MAAADRSSVSDEGLIQAGVRVDRTGVVSAELQSLVRKARHLRRDYERGGRSFAPLLLVCEREEPCEELRSLMACIARESGDGDAKGSTLLLLAALGLMLSSLGRLPCPLPEHASDLLDELESAAGRIGDVGSHAVRLPPTRLNVASGSNSVQKRCPLNVRFAADT